MSRYDHYTEFRDRLNTRILGNDEQRGSNPDGSPRQGGTLFTKRFFNLDSKVYEEGSLDTKTKELLGLVASAVLRCDDCIAYHVDRCCEHDTTDEQIAEALDIALIVGGSITIPHVRRAFEFLDECRAARAT